MPRVYAQLLVRLRGELADQQLGPKALLEALAASGEKIGLVDYLHAASG